MRCGNGSHCINVVGQPGDQTLCGWTIGKCRVTDGERSVSIPGLLSVCLRERGSYIEAEQGREEKRSHSGIVSSMSVGAIFILFSVSASF